MSNALAYIEQHGGQLSEYLKIMLHDGHGFNMITINQIFKDYNSKKTKININCVATKSNEEDYIKSHEGKEIFYIGLSVKKECKKNCPYIYCCNCPYILFTKSVFLIYSFGNIIIRRDLIFALDYYYQNGNYSFEILKYENLTVYSVNECQTHYSTTKDYSYQPTELTFE